MKRFIPYVTIVLAMLIWAGSGIAVQQSLSYVRPFTLMVIRFTIAVLIMLCVGLFVCNHESRHPREEVSSLSLQKIRWQDVPMFLLLGIMQPVLYFIFETYCYHSLASPTIAEALLSTGPLIAPLLAFLLLKEHVTKYNIIGILISSIGMLMMVLVGARNFELGNAIGIPLAFLAVCSAVMYTIMLKKIPERYSPLSVVFYGQLTSLLFFYPMWWFVEGQACLSDGFFIAVAADPTEVFYAIGYLGVCSSVIAFILYCYTVRQIGVTQANAFNNIRPVFTALIMLAFFDEQLPFGKWVGIALIVIGLFVCQKQEKLSVGDD